ncbi:MAG: DnaA regulatory inactivator Hda [Gammaproteobacteria bacterium]|nr:DnaA regulatory inactivator Hda [Gammaproteobacteria bacterium]MCW8841531.1 DnaA regulatory inactivator Hda [Gammaproteobacteria bacterium]MCW8957925.1 DnaA regulatory inactivator Hda [Gammaproteobacteria bacterium]MCW8973712.1 DnaA regulatory inactivator Hda [Gammaproteobacteria bacterium]MCW8993293.1 DnaA regulatory inactivator Hda [Gammaproteobacteria bacterium]
MSPHIPSQLPLRIGLRDGATFANFFPGQNAPVCHTLQQGREPFVYLWGGVGSGKSHLLQAACHAVSEQGGTAIYLPLAEPEGLLPQMLEGMEQMSLVCVDDLQAIAGDQEWEQALFHLYNRLRDGGNRLIAAADAPPASLGLGLVDLLSRFGWGPVYQLQPPGDEEKSAALRLRAANRGMEMPPEVAAYLMSRAPRDMHALFALLERLDEISLAAQRKLTIPFVRELIQ